MFAGIVPGSGVPPSRDEIRNDQWLGVAVTSQGPGEFLSIIFHYHYLIVNSRREGDGVRPSLHEAGPGLQVGPGPVLHTHQQTQVWWDMGALQRTGHLQVRTYDSQCSSSFYVCILCMYLETRCALKSIVKLRSKSRWGSEEGLEGQRKVSSSSEVNTLFFGFHHHPLPPVGPMYWLLRACMQLLMVGMHAAT